VALGAAGSVAAALYYRSFAAALPLGHGLPLDDAWIHVQFASSFAAGHPFQFGPGEWSSGSSAPLWSVLEGIGLVLCDDPVTVAHVLGVVFTVLYLGMAVALARRMGLSGPVLLTVPALLLAQWRTCWAAVSGMEVPLACFLVLLVCWSYLDERTRSGPAWRTGLAAGALLWTRPEGLLVAIVLMADQIFVAVSGGTPFLEKGVSPGPLSPKTFKRFIVRDLPRFDRLTGMVLAWAVAAVPYFVLNAATGPGVLPRTVYVKAHVATIERGWHHVWAFLADLMGDAVSWRVFFLGAMLAMAHRVLDARRDKRHEWLVIIVAGWLAAIAYFKGSADFSSRYIIPCIGLLTVFGVVGLHRACAAFRVGVAGEAVAVVVLLAQGVPAVLENASITARDVASVSGHVVRMGRWAARHVPRDAVIAMSDVGAMSVFTESRVVDLRGLVSPYHGWDRLAELDRQRRERVAYAFLFPELNERVILRGGYVPIHVITLDANTISASDNLVAYRTPWTDERRLEQVGASFDFEDGTMQGWTASGVSPRRDWLSDGAGPGQRRVIDLGGGRWFLSSWGPDGDAATGSIASPPFRIDGDIVTLRVGGGCLPDGVGVRLWVDGRIRRTAVGECSEVLVQREWDVRDLRGRLARLEAHDDTSEGWGHVMLDEVRQYRVLGGTAPVLADFPPEGPQEPAESRLAAERRGNGRGR
jgi:hypothetical protein